MLYIDIYVAQMVVFSRIFLSGVHQAVVPSFCSMNLMSLFLTVSLFL